MRGASLPGFLPPGSCAPWPGRREYETVAGAPYSAAIHGGLSEPFTDWWHRGWCQGSCRASLSGDQLIAIIVAAVTATVSAPVWEWLLGLK